MNFKNKLEWKNFIIRAFFCAISIVCLGLSMGFSTKSMLGTDPITVFLTGVAYKFNIELGIVVNIISGFLIILVLIFDRKCINVGTVIYWLLLGASTSFGEYYYASICGENDLTFRIIMAIIGALLGFIGLGLYMTVNIGVDPWTALAIIISKKTNKNFGIIKMSIDILVLIIGYCLGGELGIMTLITAVIAGPAIQKIHEYLKQIFDKMLKFN